jgi:cytochrome c
MEAFDAHLLWFRVGRGQEVAEYYYEGDNGDGVFSVIDFTLGGVPYQIHDVRPMLTWNDAVPIAVGADGQTETETETETDSGQRSPVTKARKVSATDRCDCADTKKCFSI